MGEKKREIEIWQGPNGLILHPSVKEPIDVVPFAHYLTKKQQQQIVGAFQIEAYDMAAEYAWKKAMVKLKETIATLGMKFIGEMIGREDFDDATSIDTEITDYTAIQLAEQLGVIGATAAMRLKQSNELITHYFSKNADEQLDHSTAFSIVKSSIQYILGEQNISIAIKFSQFREKLLSQPLKATDPEVEQVINSPLFYLRTVMTILLSSARNDIGAKLENSLANLNVIVPEIWERLADHDKWNVGTAYRDVTSAGNTVAAAGLKNALLKVNGFDYVPENLRSITFIKAAKTLLDTHFAFNNFYNEPGAIKKLSHLGSIIPAPALIQCIQAYLAVYLGNYWGVSRDAAPIAYDELSKISRERWFYYFDKVINNDDVVLSKTHQGQVVLFSNILINNNLNDFEGLPKMNQFLYDAILAKDHKKVARLSNDMLTKLRKGE